MADSRRQTRSSRRQGQQTDAQFWSNQLDQVLIERGQAVAIRLVRSTVNPTPGAATVNEPTEMNTTSASGVPPMVFVDDEGLEEQFLTEEEDTQDVLDITANRLTTPVDTIPVNQGTQQAQEEELDLQPSRGPREESLVNTIDQFLDENYEDVLHTSNIQTNFSLSASDRNLTGCPLLPLGWIVPDGTNQTLEEIQNKKISNDRSPRGRSSRCFDDESTKVRTILWNTIFSGRFENGRNVCIHVTTVEVSWIVLFQSAICGE